MTTEESLRAEITALKAERQELLDMLNEVEDYLHQFGNKAVANRVTEVVKRVTQPTEAA